LTLLRAPPPALLGSPAAGFMLRSVADDGEHWSFGAVVQK
jgi:hypothetical protein